MASTMHQCPVCSKQFTRGFGLRNHLRTHTDERPFQCELCGKAFARNHDRKTHEKLHSGEQQEFICKGDYGDGQWGCGRRFNRASNLARHWRSETGQRCKSQPYVETAGDFNATRTPPGVMKSDSDSDLAKAALPEASDSIKPRPRKAACDDVDQADNSEKGELHMQIQMTDAITSVNTLQQSSYASNSMLRESSVEFVSKTETSQLNPMPPPTVLVKLLEQILEDKGVDIDIQAELKTRLGDIPLTLPLTPPQAETGIPKNPLNTLSDSSTELLIQQQEQQEGPSKPAASFLPSPAYPDLSSMYDTNASNLSQQVSFPQSNAPLLSSSSPSPSPFRCPLCGGPPFLSVDGFSAHLSRSPAHSGPLVAAYEGLFDQARGLVW